MGNPYRPKHYRVSERIDFTDDTFLLKVPTGMNPMPGQFVEVSSFGAGECPISVCSYSSSEIDLLIRNVGNVTGKIAKLQKGDSIAIRGPYGHGYPVKEMKGKNIAIVAGGTGVAPPRSVLQYIQKYRKDYLDVDVFLGFRNPKEILFGHDIDQWKTQFKVLLTVDSCADPTFSGKVCFVTDAFGDSSILADNREVVICGPPIMMKIAVEKLKKKGFLDRQIYMSFERHMKCGVGKCGHCVVAGKYMCKDGPVFNYEVARDFYD